MGFFDFFKVPDINPSQQQADLGYSNIVEFGCIKDWTGETEPGR